MKRAFKVYEYDPYEYLTLTLENTQLNLVYNVFILFKANKEEHINQS